MIVDSVLGSGASVESVLHESMAISHDPPRQESVLPRLGGGAGDLGTETKFAISLNHRIEARKLTLYDPQPTNSHASSHHHPYLALQRSFDGMDLGDL